MQDEHTECAACGIPLDETRAQAARDRAGEFGAVLCGGCRDAAVLVRRVERLEGELAVRAEGFAALRSENERLREALKASARDIRSVYSGGYDSLRRERALVGLERIEFALASDKTAGTQ